MPRPCLFIALLVMCGGPSTEVREASGIDDGKSAERAYYQRLIRKIEPGLVGSPQRLGLYVQLFEREMIGDTRRFPFHIEAEWLEDGTVVLSGFVGFQENRAALLKFMQYLGFEHVDDRIEVLPSQKLGPRRFALVKVSHCFSFDRPTGRQEVLTDCLLGAPIRLLDKAADGFYLCHGAEGYVGYIDGKNLHLIDRGEFARYQGGDQVYVRRDRRISEALSLPIGARLKLVARQDENLSVELPSGAHAMIPAECCMVRDCRPSRRVERVLENASRLLGTRYLWGGNTSEGIDCSGLVQVAFAAEGIHLPRDADQQAYLGTLTATRDNRDGLRRGDILYFLGRHGKISHTAIYVGDDRYIESVRPTVRYTSFNPNDKDYDQHRSAAFCFAKRLLP